MTHKEIYKYVTDNNAFGIEQVLLNNGDCIGASAGIRYLLEHDAASSEQISGALKQFCSADFGTMYGSGEVPPKTYMDRSAYGEYVIKAVDQPVCMHYEPDNGYEVVVYFAFER